jgi:hypothetical protein
MLLGVAYLLVEVSEAVFCFFDALRLCFFVLVFDFVCVCVLPASVWGDATARTLPKLASVKSAIAVLMGFSSVWKAYERHPTSSE